MVDLQQVTDVQILHDQGELIPAEWQTGLPMPARLLLAAAFLVRAAIPRTSRTGTISPVTMSRGDLPEPQDSGNARYTYLAATAFAKEQFADDERRSKTSSGRSSTTCRLRHRRPGRHHDLRRAASSATCSSPSRPRCTASAAEYRRRPLRRRGAERQPARRVPVSIVDSVVDARGSRELAEAYLDYLYSPEGQEILASHANRVHDEEVRGAPCRPLSEVRLVRSRDVFGGWEQVSASTSPTRQAG